MGEVFLQALGEVTNVFTLTLILIGVLFGIIGGAVPGITVTMAILLVFPFSFAMDPINGLALMVGVFVGGYSGGIVAAVMLGIPGTPSSITTLYDGYPMRQKGEPGRALGIGIVSSFIGSIMSVLILMLLGPVIADFALNFRPWEITALIIFALTLVVSLSQGAIMKGIMAGLAGLLIATFGIDRSGNLRFDFGVPGMAAGLDMLPVMIGVFAFSQIMSNIENLNKDDDLNTPMKMDIKLPMGKVLKDFASQKVNVLRSGLVGAMVGAIPGTGGSVANFLSYDLSKKFSKEPHKYGKGYPGGIMASETSNSAVTGGAFIPTLALGIPGDLPMAIMIGVLIVHGITPGPLMFEQEPVLIGSIYVSIFIGTIFMVLLQMSLVRTFAKIALIPQENLAPIVVMLCALGSYALNNSIFDIWVFFIFGIIGYFLTKTGVPLAPIILGVVLGANLEDQLFRALELESSFMPFITRPIAATFLVLALVSLVFSLVLDRRLSRATQDLEE